MARFCKQCSLEMFGEDYKELAGYPKYTLVLCEGCGPIQVNEEGECISKDCLKEGHSESLCAFSQ